MEAREFLRQKAARTEAALRDRMAACQGIPDGLREAMAYSLFAGGKRLRPALCLGAAEIVGGSDEVALPAACALEMIHTYSLIHDDLPAMDDDDLRRGKPTCHKAFGEALAILAGDGLLTMAFGIAAETGQTNVIDEIARAAGPQGMVGGQVVDLGSEGKTLALGELKQLHALKTGALIRASVRTGAMLAGADDLQLKALTEYGEAVGLAFQIADDILDCIGTEEALGKPIGSDEAQGKSTYPALVGLGCAREEADEAVEDALSALETFGAEADTFRALARFTVERDR